MIPILILVITSVLSCMSCSQPAPAETAEVFTEVEKIADAGTIPGNLQDNETWYFLEPKGDSLVIVYSWDCPFMKITVDRKKKELNISYGQEGFGYSLLEVRSEGNTKLYLCNEPGNETDTVKIRAERLSGTLTLWEYITPYGMPEKISTVPASRLLFYPFLIHPCYFEDEEWHDPACPPDSVAGKSIHYFVNNPRVDSLTRLNLVGLAGHNDSAMMKNLISGLEDPDKLLRMFYLSRLITFMDCLDSKELTALTKVAYDFMKEHPGDFFDLLKDQNYGKEILLKWVQLAGEYILKSEQESQQKLVELQKSMENIEGAQSTQAQDYTTCLLKYLNSE